MQDFDVKNVKWTTGWRNLPECYYRIKTPSVTAVLADIPDPEFEEWVRKVGKEKVDEIMTNAGYRGTGMHTFIEGFVTNYSKSKDASEALRMTQTTSPAILAKEGVPLHKIDEGRDLFYKFYYSEFPSQFSDVIAMELGLYSPTLYYRGKLDVFYKHRLFGPAITDFKTSNGYIKKGSPKEFKYKNQLGGYANAIEEMYKEKNLIINRTSILCVNTKAEGLQEIVCEGKELLEYKESFKTLVKEWHIKNNQSYLINGR
jgi:hypothetical protein